ncbi:stAR-related lipid transfer protein 9 [Osmerus mordax]|uniref:stAR-related lipid transfer protein 9 n=1 Tax=Osmerus mordax TaxID=8014 RepID=UPI00350F4202
MCCVWGSGLDQVFQDLGVSVLSGASAGYNVCLFAYGQTGTGKTYTMMGTPDSMGLTPRICQGLFRSEGSFPDGQSSSRVEVSFLEIYNERVRDLLGGGDQKKRASLRVREHPERGPYVQDLSQHTVSDYRRAVDLLEEGIANRITAATHIHDASSRSHAIFTIQYTQAILENNLPSEIVSKINLVDLAGSERADPHYCRDRLTEGSNINKSLVTLGIVISALAQNSQMSSSSQSINSVASEGEGSVMGSQASVMGSQASVMGSQASVMGSQASSLSGGAGGGGGRRHCFIPYRDSVLTWLLKDSLGGNSKTIMIATVSPSCSSYNETLSTLRYAAHARNIVNKPRVNEDASVRLIRELRQEIDRLKSMLLSFEMRNPSPSLSDERDGNLSDIVLQNELKVEQLTKDWSESWRDKQELLEQYSVDINRDRAGFLIHSLLPHLVTLDRDVLSTGVTFYHLREGVTLISPQTPLEEPQIVLQGGATCEIENRGGVVTLRPLPGSACMVNNREVTKPCRLAQGSVITLGGVHKFRFNHPEEAAVLRERRSASEGALTCSYGDLQTLTSDFSVGGELLGQPGAGLAPSEGPLPRQRLEEQQRYVESLRQEIQNEQRRAERDLEREQAHLRQQHAEIQQWIQLETQRLAAIEERATQEFGVQTDFAISTPYQGTLEDTGGPGEPSSGPVPPSSKAVGARKKVVQEELLKHHALRRAESRVRRKRLHYQLERIARKRNLLEAKRELQRLEKVLPPGVDSPGSPELGSPPRSRGRLPVLRRHSFSADLLSRLYPRHMPVFSHFLRRNTSVELTPVSVSGRKWVSDECLPRERARSRSCTVSSSHSQGSRSRGRSSENLGQTIPAEPPLAQPCRPRPERKPLLPQRGLLFRANPNPAASQQSLPGPAAQPIRNLKSGPAADRSGPQKALCKAVRGLPRGSRGLDTLKKVFSRSVGPGIKTALARVFRKPPSGVQCGGRTSRAGGKISSRFRWRQTRDRPTGDSKMKRSSMKVTVSCEELDQRTLSRAPGQRRWHSAETLMSQTCRWVERQQGLEGWVEVENEVEGEEEEDEGSSDCDSMFSLDSLSSAYATALAEQLRQEEMFHSEAESEDSQMSKDSLAVEDRGEHHAARLGLRQTVIPKHAVVALHPRVGQHMTSEVLSRSETDTTGKRPEMPAEAYWSQHGHPKARVNGEIGATGGAVTQRRPATELKDTASKRSEECGKSPSLASYSPRSLSSCSLREPETLLALTDAWSSTDAADSPRMHRASLAQRKRMVFTAVNSSSCSLSPTSVELSDSQSRSGSYSSVSTEGDHVTVEEHRLEVSEGSLDTLDFPDSQFLSTPERLTMAVSPEPMCVKQFEGLSQTMENRDNVGGRQIIETETLLQEPGSSTDCKNENILSASQPTMSNEPGTPQVSVLADVSPERVPEIATDINVFSSGHQSKAILLPYSENELLSEVFDTESVSNVSCEDTELCYEKKVSRKVKDTESCEVTNTKDMLLNSDKILQDLETKEPDSQCAQTEQEALKPTSKNSRKRNQVNQDSFVGSLKIPKRSNEGDLVTLSSSPVRTILAVGPDNNNNGSDLKGKLSVLASDNPRFPQSNRTEDGFRQDTPAEVSMAVPGTTSSENKRPSGKWKDAVCDCKSGGVGVHEAILLEDGGVTLKREGERNEREDVESRGDKPQTDRKRRERENISPQPPRDRDSSELDLRISEVVMEHMKMSLTDGGVYKRDVEMESESLTCDPLTSQPAMVAHFPAIAANLASALFEKHQDYSEWLRKDTRTDQTVTRYREIGEPSTLIKNYSLCTEKIHPFPLVSLDISDGSAEMFQGNEGGNATQTCTDRQSSVDVQLDQRGNQHVHVVSSSSPKFSTGDLDLNAGRIHQGENNKPGMSERVEIVHQIQNTNDCFRTTLFHPAKDPPPTQYFTVDCQKIELVQTMNPDSDVKQPSHHHKPFTIQGGRFSGDVSTSAKECSTPQEVLSQLKSTKLPKNSTTLLIAVELSSAKSSSSQYSPDKQNGNQSHPNESVDVQGLSASPETLNSQINRNHPGHQRDINLNQPLLAQPIYPQTQLDNAPHVCVNVGARDNQANMKDDQYLLGKRLTVGCSKNNLALTLRQLAKDEEESVTNQLPTKSPVITPMEKSLPGIASSPNIPQGSRDGSIKILADSCGDYRSKEGDAKTNCKQSHSIGASKKGKSKRFRRVQAQILPSSSSDSTLKSSSDEEENIIRVNRNRCSPTSRLKIGSHRSGQPDVALVSGVAVASSKPKVTTIKETCRASGRRGRDSGVCVSQKEHGVTARSLHVVEVEKRTGREKAVFISMAESEMLPCTPKPRDSPMHFASSDINPFVHQWQSEDADQRCHKTPAFGSAADLTCKSPLLNGVEKHITRCCSVDNGLNVQNSPFNSHLSTYANNKGLSSTLSSIEDFQEPTSHKSQLSPGSDGSCVNQQPPNMTEAVRSNSSRNSVSVGLGTSLGQVDEIMLVYSSEQESQTGRPQACGMMCDHGTQTTGDVGKRIRHRRSSTQVPQSTRVRDASRESNTWASLQNMSEHLSQLIHSTSDLLGNVQCMRNGDVLKRSPRNSPRHVQVSHCYSKDQTKRDCSTQTAVDIGIQTEKTPMPALNKMSVYQYPSVERSKPHEVNVIVKVIGSEVLNVSQEDNSVCRDRVQTNTDDKIQSMPDLRTNGSPIVRGSICQQVGAPHKVLSMETVVHCPNQPRSAVHSDSSSGLKPELSPRSIRISEILSSSFQDVSQENLKMCANPEVSSVKQQQQQTVIYTDRASSPILTVGVRPGQRREQAVQLHKKHQTPKMPNGNKDQIDNKKACWSTPCLNLLVRERRTSLSLTDRGEMCELDSSDSSISKSESVSLENVSALRHSSTKETDERSVSSSADNESRCPIKEIRDTTFSNPTKQKTSCQSLRWSISSLSSNGITMPNHTPLTRRSGACRQEGTSVSTLEHLQSYKRRTTAFHHRELEDPGEYHDGGYDPTPISKRTIQLQEDDLMSLAPSECNTDVLVNINPIGNPSPQPEHGLVPEDLPMHNKFTNWSGISHQLTERRTSGTNKPAACPPDNPEVRRRSQAKWDEMESKHGSSLGPENLGSRDRKSREIERLRKEREQVMSTVHLHMNPHQLTVELTEAKLHYGLGETDTLLKMLSSGSREEPSSGSREEPSSVPSNQQLYDGHRRSIEGLRQEREARLQTYRRARSLSPSKHPRSPPQEDLTSSRVSALPSRRKDYLQQLRQEVVDSTRIPDPPRGEGHYPSEIEQLLRDYGRAREEARTEIARARERLRERTEQEKRRLQQQALSQVVTDDLRHRTRISSSTLCTGSSLSLSSGPTSGYNSGNTTHLKDGCRPTLTAPGVHEDGLSSRARPPLAGSQGIRSQRAWLSVQDVRLEPGVLTFDPLMSSPSSPTSLRQRTASFGSSSSISTAYQDITSCLLGRALAEVRLAAGGDIGNLVMGKATAGWRYQGSERGVQAYHRPSSSPSVHGFLGAAELDRPLASLWGLVREPSKTHLLHLSVRSAWTRPLDGSTQLVYLVTDPSSCHLKQPRDFCCVSTEARQGDLCVLAMQSVFEESLPRPSMDIVRAEMLPSAWLLQPITRGGREVVRVIFLLQVDLGSPSLPQRVLNAVARRQASAIAELDAICLL